MDLEEWAISMMDRHNRKSYLAPPAPKSLKEDTPSSTRTPKAFTNKATPRAAQPPYQPVGYTPTSAEIPLNVSDDLRIDKHGYRNGGSVKPSTTTFGLEQLSLESDDLMYRSPRYAVQDAVHGGGYGPRSSSKVPSNGRALRPEQQPGVLPLRTAATAGIAPGQTPVPSAGSRVGQAGQMRNER